MQKIGSYMNLFMGFTMSFVLSLVGTASGGHFTVQSWLLSFAMSFVLSIIIGFVVPVKILGDGLCEKFKVNPSSFGGNLLSGLVSDLVYTPAITAAMVYMMLSISAAHAPAGAVPPFGIVFPKSLALSFGVAYIVIIIVTPLYLKLLIKMSKNWKDDKPRKNKLMYISLVLIASGFVGAFILTAGVLRSAGPEIRLKTFLPVLVVFVLYMLLCFGLIRKGYSIMARNVMLGSYGNLSDIYDGAYIVEPKSGMIKEIKNLVSDGRYIFDVSKSLYEQSEEVVLNWVEEEYRENCIKFFQIGTREQNLNKSHNVYEFVAKELGWVRATLVSVRDKKTNKLEHLVFAFDIIDEEVKKQEALRIETEVAKAASEAAKAASEAKGRFLANMSHEIRTPINAVLGMNTMILRECSEPDIITYAQNIQNAGATLLSLINDILDISKIESGKMDIVPVEYDVASLINDVVSMVSLKADSKGLVLVPEISRDIPSLLFGDDIRIKQILLNIMNNAVKYTEKGSITFTASHRVEDNNAILHFSIKDTGIGIKEEDMKRLFSDFERIEEARNRNVEGTGLGMSITLQLLRLMGTKLEVNSVYGEGTEFYFDLCQEIRNAVPVGDFTNHLSQQKNDFDYNASFIAPDARVLVVDDNSTNLFVFANLLKETRVQIDEADGGMSGLDKLLNNPYDLVFLDHMMPDMDGVEVMHKFHEEASLNPKCINVNTPVIALTANAISGAREMYLKAGFTDYLSKPILSEELEKILAQFIPEDKKQPFVKSDASKQKTGNAYVSELPAIEGVDWNLAALHFTGKDMLLSTLEAFYYTIDVECEQISNIFKQLKDDCENKDILDQFRIKVHALKSSANLLGIVPIAGTAALLEYASRAENVRFVLDVTPHFLDSFAEYKGKLRELALFSKGEGEVDYDAALTRGLLINLQEAAENFDVDEIDGIVEKLSESRYEENLEEALGKLKGVVNNLDTEGIIALSKQMLSMLD